MRALIALSVLLALLVLAGCGDDKAEVSPAPATTQLTPLAPPDTTQAPETTETAPATTAPAAKPVAISLQTDAFGNVLARPDRQALYYWAVEKRAGGKVECVAACANAWPPLYAKNRAVSERVPGVPGRFGVIARPDGRLQVTHDGLPVYTYAHEPPGVVLCDDVDDWFVVRLG
jgi:predicted lipoprotein with Yx(FWY)xxD motif